MMPTVVPYSHQPVLLSEVLTGLAIDQDGCYVDATWGRGGHSKGILEQLSATGRLLAIDQDWEAIIYANTAVQDSRLIVKHSNFVNIKSILLEQGWYQKTQGVLFDLGVSSPQLDTPERGFSFMRDGPLDMRMNVQQGITAEEWLAKISEKELANVLFQGGEERFARRVARAIVEARHRQSIQRTTQLAAIIAAAIPKRQPGKHPATQSFQAIRIAINQELTVLSQALQDAISSLAKTGRICVISFHSTEDQIVKRVFREQSGQSGIPYDLPIRQADLKVSLKILGRCKPSAAEIAANPRARSATLTIAEKMI